MIVFILKGKVFIYGGVVVLVGMFCYVCYVGIVLKNLFVGSKIFWYWVVNSKGEFLFLLGSDYW